MRKRSSFSEEASSEAQMTQILSPSKGRGENCDALQKLLDELDALIPTRHGGADLERVRNQLRAAIATGGFSEAISIASAGREQLLRLPEVMKRVGLRKSAIYDKIRKNEFPRAVAISKRARAWRASKITQWIATRDS